MGRKAAGQVGSPMNSPSSAIDTDMRALIDAVANAHIGVRMGEGDALMLLIMMGMDKDEADDLLTAQREEASQE
jgi:hypothetical protein